MQNTVLYVNTASYEQYRPKISKVNMLYIIYTRILKYFSSKMARFSCFFVRFITNSDVFMINLEFLKSVNTTSLNFYKIQMHATLDTFLQK